jgi:hypothetical protein
LEEHVASISGFEAKQETRMKQVALLVTCLTYYSILKMEATYSSETSDDLQWSTWHYITEDRTFHNHRCENLKSYNALQVWINQYGNYMD